jgi:hypothetical protein
MIESTQRWAVEEFGRSSFGDRRVTNRLITMAGEMARRPRGRVTEVFLDGAARQGAYGLLEEPKITTEEVAAGIFAACASRSAKHKYVFVAVDGTSLTLVDRAGAKDFGSVGSRKNGARGLKVMNAMALSPQGVPLGLTAQQWWVRPNRRRRKNRDFRLPQQKETHHWLEAIRQSKQVMATHAPATTCWFQLDREGDAWPTLTELGLEDHWFTVRSAQNRRVLSPHGRKSKLRTVLSRLPVQDAFTMEVKGSSRRRGRLGKFTIRSCAVALEVRDKRSGRRSKIDVNVVRVRESGTTPRTEKPIDWILLTNHPVNTSQERRLVVLGYSMRWRIEEMHKTWKSGGCRVEETQLRSTQAVKKWATISAAVAVRIERIKQLSRETPSSPATEEFSDREIRAVALLRFGEDAERQVPKGVVPTIEQLTYWIAELGGYTGKKSSGGPPGSITIGRGLADVRTAAKALKALGL